MSASLPEPFDGRRPSPDNLAGIPACKEESLAVTIRETGVEKEKTDVSAASSRVVPTADQLAGVPITADGKEDLTVRPRKPRKKR
jgi:hypothetical protein